MTWKTPYSSHSLRSLSASFPSHLISCWQQVLVSSVEEGTHGSYGAGLLRFNHFCDLHHIPEVERMPASEALLSIFISSYGAGHVAPGTVSTWLAGPQLWHAVNNAPWHGDALLSRTRKGVSKLAPASSHRLPRDPSPSNTWWFFVHLSICPTPAMPQFGPALARRGETVPGSVRFSLTQLQSSTCLAMLLVDAPRNAARRRTSTNLCSSKSRGRRRKSLWAIG